MSNTNPSAAKTVSSGADLSLAGIIASAKRLATPYHLTVAAVIGGITAVFAVVIALLIIVALNFNVLGLIE